MAIREGGVIEERQGDVRLLEARAISKSWPGVRALDQVSITIRAGEIHALVGENGAGKSTLIKILAGIVQPDEGSLFLDGVHRQLSNPVAAQKAGIGIVFQELNLVPTLDIATNIYLSHEFVRGGVFLNKRHARLETARVLKMLGITLSAKTLVQTLSIAQIQMIAIARALSFHPRVLLLDEPTSSLSEGEIEKLYQTLRVLRAQGVGILYVSHRLEEISQIADCVTVLRDGKLVDTKPIGETTIDSIITMMVGRAIVTMYPKESAPRGEETLRVLNMSRGNVVDSISLTVRSGEVVGLFGLVGAGRTELARLIFGLDPPDSGEIHLYGKRITRPSPSGSIERGLGYLSENRQGEGLCPPLTVRQNIVRASLHRMFPSGVKNLRKERLTAQKQVAELDIATPSLDRAVQFLSGGTQQKVVFAHWMCAGSRMLILDEPTRGIDVGTKVEIYKMMNRLAKAGASILLISSDLPELQNMSDRVYVMYQGKITEMLEGAEMNAERIIAAAIGVGRETA
jgi:ribose transport system ATP-binding protein